MKREYQIGDICKMNCEYKGHQRDEPLLKGDIVEIMDKDNCPIPKDYLYTVKCKAKQNITKVLFGYRLNPYHGWFKENVAMERDVIVLKIPNKYISRAVQECCFDQGIGWFYGKGCVYRDLEIGGHSLIRIMKNNKGIGKGIHLYTTSHVSTVPVNDFLNNPENYIKFTLNIAGQDITPTQGGFKVGGQFVSWEDWKRVGELQKR